MMRPGLLALAAVLLGAALPQTALAADDGPDLTQVTEYTVKPGETLGGIAQRVQVPRILIIEANGLKAPYAVRKGQVLIIPRRRSRTVKPGETGFSIAYDEGIAWNEIALANGMNAKDPVRVGQKLVIPTLSKPGIVAPPPAKATTPVDGTPSKAVAAKSGPAKPALAGSEPNASIEAPVRFAWPAPGKVRRGFVARGKPAAHDGIDITGAEGSAVRAAAAGNVVFAGREPKRYGNLVIVDHGRGWFSAYAKLSKVTVKKGELVSAGERVGLIGNTGSTPQTELHFEIRSKTIPQDPARLLPRRESGGKN